MAERIIYFGPFNNEKKKELFNMSLSYLKEGYGNKFYYVLPHGGLLKDYRKRFIYETGKTFEINLFTFDDIVNNILKDEVLFIINDSMKDLIIKKSVMNLIDEGKLSYYKNITSSKGFIESLNYIIGEIKRSLVYPQEYLSNCPANPYFKEIGLIYDEYEKLLKSCGLTDREGAYFKAIDILDENLHNFDRLDFIIIDEFYDFRPVEMEILKKLSKTNADIYINIPFEMKTRMPIIENTLKMLKDLGFEVKHVNKTERNIFETIGYNFFNEGFEKLDYTDNIRLIKSPNIKLELKKVFEEIKRHYKNGCKLEDMAIILLSDEYKDSLIKISSEEKVPLNIRNEIPLIQVPLIKEFLNLIETRINKGEKQRLISRLKSYYFNIVDEEHIDAVELILRRMNFSSLEELVDILNKGNYSNSYKEYMELIGNTVNKLKDEIDLISNYDLVENYNKVFKEIIKNYDIRNKIFNRYKKDENYQLLYRDMQALDKLLDIIEKMLRLSMIEKGIRIEDYFDALLKAVKNESILQEDANNNGVKVLNPINSRGFNHEILFIVGLSQSYYPVLNNNNFFINDANSKYLRDIGLDYKNYYYRLNNEVIKFASIIASCKNVLYLSLSEGTEENSVFSMFLDELLNMFKGENIEEKVKIISLGIDYQIKNNISDITTLNELSYYLISNLNNLTEELKPYYWYHNTELNDKFKDINAKNYCEYKRSQPDFNEYNGLISNENIKKDLEEIHRNKVYSNTYLEAYSKCPYYFLLNNILKVEEMGRYFQEYRPIDIGSIYHEVLKEYYNTFRNDLEDCIKNNKAFNVDDTRDYIRGLVEKYAVQFGYDKDNRLNQLVIENVYNRLIKLIENDIDRISNSEDKLIPFAFEVEFGSDDDFSVEIDGEEVKLRGKIDRIDKILNEDKYVIVDYKSSSYGVYDIDDMSKGLSLQLPIYVLSQKDKDVVAGVYGVISNGEFQVKLGILGETKLVSPLHRKAAVSRDVWDKLMEDTKANIKNILAGILNGNFSVNPMECSKYCIYRNVCRYEKLSEVE